MVKNLFYETNPRFHKWSKRVYLKSFTKSGRQLYRLFYYTSKKMSKYKKLHIFSYGYSHLEELIRVEEPDLIINTFPSFAAPNFILKGNRYIPCYNVITDYCLHDSWVHPYIEKYYVATTSVKQELVNKGVLMEKICVTGIPILKEYE
ncbi:MAG: diglucosyl diacylglycerol synthase, partial [Bacillaceae bacterium]|nr:diglucosyl diacylglycerol synthase [Bacillaceae bacterium]